MSDMQCPMCGVTIQAGLSICWNCQHTPTIVLSPPAVIVAMTTTDQVEPVRTPTWHDLPAML